MYDHSKVVPLLHLFFVCASVISYVAFAVSLFVKHPSFLWRHRGGLCFVIVAFSGCLHIYFSFIFLLTFYTATVCVCVEVLRPSQPNGVKSSAVSLPNHTFTGQA